MAHQAHHDHDAKLLVDQLGATVRETFSTIATLEDESTPHKIRHDIITRAASSERRVTCAYLLPSGASAN